MKTFWKNQKILVTGAGGFLGTNLIQALIKKGLNNQQIIQPGKKNHDLREKKVCQKLVKNHSLIIHLAANVGGIGYLNTHSGAVFYDNVIMGTELMEAARQANVAKFVSVGTGCSYPSNIAVPYKEDNLWKGYPDPITGPYGISKKILIVQSQVYRKQYGFNSIHLIPSNLYGPFDHFNLQNAHVIPALINKIFGAKKEKAKEVCIWGSGKATREFLYVEDAAEGILLASEKYNKSDPVNLGIGVETSIAEVVELIIKIIGYKGRIKFDLSKPEGKSRVNFDVQKAYKEFGFKAKISLNQGLEKTIDWYRKDLKQGR